MRPTVPQIQALQGVFPKLARCKTPSEVAGVAIDGMRQAFAATTCCAIFLDDSTQIAERTLHGIHDVDFDIWAQDWREKERVFPAVLTHAVPVHNWQVYREDEWQRDPVYAEYGRRIRVYHYMSAPIFGSRGHLTGALTLCRWQQHRAFDARALGLASVFSGFLSAALARVQEAPLQPDADRMPPLSVREHQIARLAATGRNNLEIALQLGIGRETVKQTLRRVYRKLDVKGRVEMATRLVAHEMLIRPV
jgi:DNA-binding CsgD family transcriptional regulator